MMNIIELSAILYYADFLALKMENRTVTDNCKYMFICSTPINSAYVIDKDPFYDPEDKYYIQAYTEYNSIKDKFGQEGALDFVSNLCDIQALGVINAKQMLGVIFRFSNKYERNQAMQRYEGWKSRQHYTHLVIDEDNQVRKECSRYVARQEQGTDTQPQYTVLERKTKKL